ncbi:hypothetical protein Pyn_36967 [Prunus yedoensis var. nudiflora]|uniref:Uncharacterized protein n=1 Tax=Prunus yedoensis var. nudiflora TaxID=2094558 RepID=A0A314YFZ5_PRUYE|nr:hypothetical protein Pyn_36967 [Prunus yedoensis var. nudiflora]
MFYHGLLMWKNEVLIWELVYDKLLVWKSSEAVLLVDALEEHSFEAEYIIAFVGSCSAIHRWSYNMMEM